MRFGMTDWYSLIQGWIVSPFQTTQHWWQADFQNHSSRCGVYREKSCSVNQKKSKASQAQPAKNSLAMQGLCTASVLATTTNTLSRAPKIKQVGIWSENTEWHCINRWRKKFDYGASTHTATWCAIKVIIILSGMSTLGLMDSTLQQHLMIKLQGYGAVIMWILCVYLPDIYPTWT